MQLKVNGQAIDITIETEKTVGDILKAFENEIAKNDATTVSISLNGKEIGASDFDAILAEPLTETTDIALSVISKGEIIHSFASLAQDFALLTERLSDIPVLLQSGKDKEASAIIIEVASKYNAFCHTARMSTLFPDVYSKITADDKASSEFFKDLLPVLTDFEEAMKGKDSVTMGDIAEYELKPRLQTISDALAVFVSEEGKDVTARQ